MPRNKNSLYAIILAIFSGILMLFNVIVFRFDATHPGVQFPIDLRLEVTVMFGVIFLVSQWMFWSHLSERPSPPKLPDAAQVERIEKITTDTNARVREIENTGEKT